jgi:hypothetical protein
VNSGSNTSRRPEFSVLVVVDILIVSDRAVATEARQNKAKEASIKKPNRFINRLKFISLYLSCLIWQIAVKGTCFILSIITGQECQDTPISFDSLNYLYFT